MMGLEPTTFCMASRRSSQLSYIRAAGASIAPALLRRARVLPGVGGPGAGRFQPQPERSRASLTRRSASVLCSLRTAR